MRFVAIIPARYESTRFPGKPLKLLNNKPIIQHVYENVKSSQIFDDVIVATDNEKIYQAVKYFNGNVQMTSSDHQSGSDRIAEVTYNIEADVIVNVQGDEPFISGEPLYKLIKVFDDPEIEVATLMHKMHIDQIINPNIVKVVLDNNNFSLYFSRAPIPFNRDQIENVKYYRHIGIYAFRRDTLLKYVQMPVSNLEQIEKLEQLRLLENNIKIKMVETDYEGIGIDTPEDLLKAEEIIRNSEI